MPPQQHPILSLNKQLTNSVAKNNITECKRLVEAGANVMVMNTKGGNLLHVAADWSKSIEVLRWVHDSIIAGGYTLEDCDVDGCTPLFISAANGNCVALKWLIGMGANLAIKNKQEANCLHLAASRGHADILMILL